MKNSIIKLLGAASLCAGFALPASAGNIVINGGFENGVDRWTFGSSTSLFSGGHTGEFSVRGQCPPASLNCFSRSINYSHVKQVLTTVPGEMYTLSFWAHSQSNAIAEIAVDWNGLPVEQHILFSSGEYRQYSITGLIASHATTELKIYLGNHGGGTRTYIDDIGVYGQVPQVPEPAMAGLLLAGLGVIGVLRRRARTSA